ncbi:MAG: DUF2970 domain-containing protein [Variovorax sp.]|nr:MAG: DUF2970 domain-containing protein [Variovorax sp.]
MACGLHHRSEDFEGREDHHVVVHLLRGWRPDSCRSDRRRGAGARGAPIVSPARKGSLGRTLKAVAWGFFGVRKNSAYEEDIARLTPLHIVVVGLCAAIVLVGGLILLVKYVVAP